jgi:class 3 adenylate cyclase/tetratricopeptide (TPR) repeat protein
VAPDARFCASCGTRLGAESEHPTPAAGEELKVISVLFCDLVGFTSHTERTDPEAVRERLTLYHARVRADVERFGGRVEKLMGDGVFAVFGSPTVHEDDPERAVRAALRIQDSLAEMNEGDPTLALSVRIAVTTGEAIIQLTPTPDREGIIGDVVNTASRLQGVAPVGGVVVDERTHAGLRDLVEFEPLDPVEVKGKTGSMAIWRAVAVRSRFGVAVDAEASVVFVGRSHELNLLTEAFQRAEEHSSAQLVTIVGEPGVGKSRLMHELFRWIDDRPQLVWWRHGRCLPYGEGITFWALGEIVKSHAGILEAEPPAQAAHKLTLAVSTLIDDPGEAEWVRARLAPLVGLPGGGAERDELFNAWHRFLEALAARNPLVLAIEDIHWADTAMVEFLEQVLDWSHDLPILLVCTARPELYTERPEWGAGRRDAVTIGLSALGPDETIELVRSLSKRSVMPANAQQALLERSGGNPLYVTEYVRLAAERGLLDRMGEAELPLPDTIQALIAARLDLLGADDKAIVQAAAVVGKVFWTGALAFVRGVDVEAVRATLRRLVQRELVRPIRRSSMFGQEEHSFVHVLARDVAYSQIPRRERASLHLATARWLEAKAEDRLIDVSEQLAHHYTTSISLGATVDPEVRERAFRFLMMAAERAEALDIGQAAAYYRNALSFADSPVERARAHLGIGDVTFDNVDTAEKATEAALAEFTEAGDGEGRLRALAQLGSLAWYRGEGERAEQLADEALAECAGMPPSRALADALIGVASRLQLNGREEEALEIVERGIAVAQTVGETDLYGRGLVIRGSTLTQMGDHGGEADVEDGLRIFLDLNRSQWAMQAYNNLATCVIALGEAERGRDVIDEAIEYGTVRALTAHVDWSRMTKCEALFPLGAWDEIESIVADLRRADEARGGTQVGLFAEQWAATVMLHRGNQAGARRLWSEGLDAAREVDDPQTLFPSLALGVEVCTAVGDRTQAVGLANELIDLSVVHPAFGALHLPSACRAIIALDLGSRLEPVLDRLEVAGSSFLEAQREWMRARVGEGEGDPVDMLAACRRLWEVAEPLGQRYWSTVARIDGARSLLRSEQVDEATALLEIARTDANKMGARLLLDQIDALERGEAAASS